MILTVNEVEFRTTNNYKPNSRGKDTYTVTCLLCRHDLPSPLIAYPEIWARSHLDYCTARRKE